MSKSAVRNRRPESQESLSIEDNLLTTRKTKRRSQAEAGAHSEPRKRSGQKQPERRASPRVRLEVDIGVHSETNFYTGLSQDISAGGIFVATHELLEIGTQVTVSFALPATRKIEADGIVAWVRDPRGAKPGMGIGFERLGKEEHALIERFIAKRPPLYHDDEI